jgi:YVTN family beta-propeller protein
MTPTRVYFIILLILILGSCLPQGPVDRVPTEAEGKIVLYLQPMTQEASRLRFIIESIVAVRDDNLKIPLSLSISELKGAALAGRQKRLASGWLPEGSYSGISIKVAKAFVQGEEGEAALLVPKESLVIEHRFRLRRKTAQALFLTFNASEALAADGVRFRPVFSLTASGRELTSLTGYVSNSGSNSITVFNKKTMQVVNVIATGTKPKGMVLDERRGRAYVAASGDDAVQIIDVLKGKIIGSIILQFKDEPVDLALTRDGKTLVSVNHGSNTISIIDAVSGIEARRVKVGERPVSAVLDPAGVKAYIMNSMSNTISVVDLSQRVISITLGIEGSPARGAFNRNGDRLYVISTDSPNLTIIDTARLTVVEKLFIGMGAVSIKVDVRTNLILVGMQAGEGISVISPFSLMLIDTIGIAGDAAFMTIDDEEYSLLVTLPDRETLQKVNLTSKRIMAEIEVGEAAYAVVVTGER